MDVFFGVFITLVLVALIIGTIWISLPSKVLGNIELSLSEKSPAKDDCSEQSPKKLA